MRTGRPLRFLVVTLSGWTAVRVALLWPTIDSVPAAIRALAPPLGAETLALPPMQRSPVVMGVPAAGAVAPVARHPAARAVHARQGGDPHEIALALAGLVRFGETVGNRAAPVGSGVIPPPLRPTPPPAPGSRWSGSAWLLARGGGGGTLSGGQLGASQAGVRVAYALGGARRVALVGRVATPLKGRGKEAAVGVEWRPGRLPVRLIAEQRVALDGGRGGPTVMGVAGLGPVAVGGLRLEAYGQAGVIVRDGLEGFGDGAARLTRTAASIGGAVVDVGIGSWGAAQRGARRLDLGPTLGLAVPVAGRSLRLTLDWRQRVAGEARPGSGPALSIGTDF